MSKLDDVFEALYGNAMGAFATNTQPNSDEYKEQIKSLFIEIIGENELDRLVDFTYQEWRNELRNELRWEVSKL